MGVARRQAPIARVEKYYLAKHSVLGTCTVTVLGTCAVTVLGTCTVAVLGTGWGKITSLNFKVNNKKKNYSRYKNFIFGF